MTLLSLIQGAVCKELWADDIQTQGYAVSETCQTARRVREIDEESRSRGWSISNYGRTLDDRDAIVERPSAVMMVTGARSTAACSEAGVWDSGRNREEQLVGVGIEHLQRAKGCSAVSDHLDAHPQHDRAPRLELFPQATQTGGSEVNHVGWMGRTRQDCRRAVGDS